MKNVSFFLNLNHFIMHSVAHHLKSIKSESKKKKKSIKPPHK